MQLSTCFCSGNLSLLHANNYPCGLALPLPVNVHRFSEVYEFHKSGKYRIKGTIEYLTTGAIDPCFDRNGADHFIVVYRDCNNEETIIQKIPISYDSFLLTTPQVIEIQSINEGDVPGTVSYTFQDVESCNTSVTYNTSASIKSINPEGIILVPEEAEVGDSATLFTFAYRLSRTGQAVINAMVKAERGAVLEIYLVTKLGTDEYKFHDDILIEIKSCAHH